MGRALRRGPRRSGSRNDPRRASRLGRRWRPDSQPEDGPQSDHRRHRRRHRHGAAGGHRVGPYRPCGDHVAGRLCRGGERGRARCRRAVRGTTRFHDPARNKGRRGARHRRDGGRDRQCGLSRDRHAGPLVADLGSRRCSDTRPPARAPVSGDRHRAGFFGAFTGTYSGVPSLDTVPLALDTPATSQIDLNGARRRRTRCGIEVSVDEAS